MPRGFKFLSRSALAAAMLLVLIPAQTVAPQTTQVDRTQTLILDMDSGRDLTPDIWNPFLPSRQMSQGFHQAILEPLFILNYETGQILPWTGLSMTPNDAQDVWTLVLRPGVTWSDGVAFSADDVVFTIQMLINHAPDLVDSANMKEWVKSVDKIDDQTVQFTLNKPNPRFQLDYFSVGVVPLRNALELQFV
jgi:peptide/nickel transport system substrate-binding protein